MQRFDWSALQSTSREDVDLLCAAQSLVSSMLQRVRLENSLHRQVAPYALKWSATAVTGFTFGKV